MGLVNASMAMLFAFGIHISQDQRGAVTAFVNAALVLMAHTAHSQAKRSAKDAQPTTEQEG